jgi:hypothetical protein
VVVDEEAVPGQRPECLPAAVAHVDVHVHPAPPQQRRVQTVLRLSVLMDLYIHPLYILVSKILSSILNSSALIHSLYHPLSTLFIVGPTCHFI